MGTRSCHREVAIFATICAVSSWVSDSVLELILDDRRAVLEAGGWKGAAQHNIEVLGTWCLALWWLCVARGLAASSSANGLQEKVKHSAYVQYVLQAHAVIDKHCLALPVLASSLLLVAKSK